MTNFLKFYQAYELSFFKFTNIFTETVSVYEYFFNGNLGGNHFRCLKNNRCISTNKSSPCICFRVNIKKEIKVTSINFLLILSKYLT